MNDILENKMSRAFTLQDLMSKNKTKWETNKAIKKVMTEIDTSVQNVQNLDAELLKNKKGITEDKKNKQTDLINSALKLQAGVLAYAASINDIILLKSIGFSKSKIEHSRDTVVYDLCKSIYDTAEPLKTELVDFMLVQEDFDKTKGDLEKYEASMQAPRTAVSEDKTKNANLNDEVKKIDDLIRNKLNYLMLPFRASDSKFYNSYKTACLVIELGKRKTVGTIKITGKVIDFESGKSLANVKIWVEGVYDIKTTSKADGSFELTLKNAGTYVILAEKEGYYQAEDSLDVEEKNSYEMNIDMELKVGTESE